MWGGLRINLFNAEPNAIQKGHKYRISITVTGKTSRPSSGGIYFSNSMGWSGAAHGLSTSPAICEEGSISDIPPNFNGTMVASVVYNVTDDVWKECTNGGYSTFKEGYKYNCYRDLCFGFGYADTGPIGTDIYLTNIRMEDVTDLYSSFISNGGVLTSNLINEVGPTDGLVGWWKLDGDAKDYSIYGNHGTVKGANISNGLNQLCYNFNYDNKDYIDMGIWKVLYNTNTVTVSTWSYSNNITRSQNIVSGNGPMFVRIVNSKARYCILASAKWTFVSGTINLESNKWNNILMIYDGTNIIGYINGIKDISVPHDNPGNLVTFASLRFGFTTGGKMHHSMVKYKIYVYIIELYQTMRLKCYMI